MTVPGEFDQMALRVCRSARKNHPDIKIEVVLTSYHTVEKKHDIDYVPYQNVITTIFNIEDLHFKQQIVASNRQMIGVYRKIPVKIMGAFTEPAQPYLIELKMNELLVANETRKEQMHPIERIARFHLEFEGIHPFIDGNGRTGRLIMNLDLIRNGFPPINVKFTDRKRYYDAFDVFYRDNDASAMINLIAEYVDARLDEYLDVLNA